MEYKEFVEKVANDLKKMLPESLREVEIETRQVDKLQDEGYFGITVKPKNSNFGISTDLEPFFRRLWSGEDYTHVVKSIAESLEKEIRNAPNFDLSFFTDYEKMKETLMLRVVGVPENSDMLSKIPHTIFGDIAITYRFILDNRRDMTSSVLVTNDLLKTYGITKEQLHEDAVEASEKNFPYAILPMYEVMAKSMEISADEMPDKQDDLYIATCNQGTDGAGCLFYPDFLEDAAEMLGGSFYVLPSSIHELILLQDRTSFTCDELETMVRDINKQVVEAKDRLSNTVYHYDDKQKLLEKAKDYEMKVQNAKRRKHEYER